MSNPAVPGKAHGRSLTHNLLLFLPAVILFITLTAISVWRAYAPTRPQFLANGVPASQAIEEKFGVQFTGVHVIARGGLVDLRYRVVNAGKAKNFGHYTETSPLILSEKNGKTVEVTIMGLHNHRVETGRTYYILYRNTADALHPGDKVTIQVGDLRIEHFEVK